VYSCRTADQPGPRERARDAVRARGDREVALIVYGAHRGERHRERQRASGGERGRQRGKIADAEAGPRSGNAGDVSGLPPVLVMVKVCVAVVFMFTPPNAAEAGFTVKGMASA